MIRVSGLRLYRGLLWGLLRRILGVLIMVHIGIKDLGFQGLGCRVLGCRVLGKLMRGDTRPIGMGMGSLRSNRRKSLFRIGGPPV